MLFTFEQMGGLPGLASWLAVADRFRPALSALLSVRYMAGMYSDNRFLNTVLATETFHRIRFDNNAMPIDEFKCLRRTLVESAPEEHRERVQGWLQFSNERPLRDRLLESANYAGGPFKSLAGNMDEWARRVIQTRNRFIHYDAKKPYRADGATLHFLSESLFI